MIINWAFSSNNIILNLSFLLKKIKQKNKTGYLAINYRVTSALSNHWWMQSGQLVESNQEKFGKFLSLDFTCRRKLCKISVFYEKINTAAFILCGKVFIFLRFGLFLFLKCIYLLAFPILVFYGTAFRIEKFQSDRQLSIVSTGWREKNVLPENMHRK